MSVRSIINVKGDILEVVIGQIQCLRIKVRAAEECIIEIIVTDIPEKSMKNVVRKFWF
jgi:hypothetical protein